MNIFQRLTEKPWLVADHARPDESGGELNPSAAPTGLIVYMGVATVLFSLIVAAYFMRMGVGHLGFGFDWRPTPKPWLLWVNTFLLVLSSVMFQQAHVEAHRDQADRVVTYLLSAGLFAFAFLAGQLTVWRQLANAGYYLASNPANSFFYLITTVHGLHLVGGLVAWTRTTARVWNGIEITKMTLSVDLCANYWHFLLVVWLACFCLLLVT